MVKILVVDDEARMRKLIKKILSEKYDVVGEAEDGEEAIRKYEELDPDVVTLDIQMPKMDGFEVLSEIKEKDESKKVVLITVCSSDNEVPEKLKDEADAHVVKPAKKKQLLNAIEDVLKTD